MYFLQSKQGEQTWKRISVVFFDTLTRNQDKEFEWIFQKYDFKHITTIVMFSEGCDFSWNIEGECKSIFWQGESIDLQVCRFTDSL